jgi:PPOX class probable F420-dependent enzyme
MDIDTGREMLRTQHRAVLATYRPDGAAQMTPVTATVDDAGRAIISTRQTAYKVRNIRRDPRVHLCALPDGFFGRWLHIDGVAELVELPEAMDLLVDYYRRISGEHPDWDDYRAAMERDQRLLVRVEMLRVGPDREG